MSVDAAPAYSAAWQSTIGEPAVGVVKYGGVDRISPLTVADAGDFPCVNAQYIIMSCIGIVIQIQ